MVQIFADSNRARLRMLKEDDNAWGTTPATGRTREVRYTGSTINANKETATSEEIRADRMVAEATGHADGIVGDARAEAAELLDRASQRRDALFGTRVTYSPKVFIPLTILWIAVTAVMVFFGVIQKGV